MVSRTRFKLCHHPSSSNDASPSYVSKPPSSYYNRTRKLRLKSRSYRRFPFTTPTPKPFTIGSVNINGMSLQSALAIQQLLDKKKYDIFAVSETHFRQGIAQERFPFPGYSSWHSERSTSERGGGGLVIYYQSYFRKQFNKTHELTNYKASRKI